MKKIIESIMILGMLLASSIASVNALEINEETEKCAVLNSTVNNFNSNENWALMIDVFPYTDLTTSVVDTFCQGGWNSENIRYCHGTELTESEVIENFSWIVDHSTNLDSVFISLHAHGGGDAFYDDNLKGIMTWGDFDDQVDRINANKIALFIDTCHSGGAIPYLDEDNRIILTVCAEDESSVFGVEFLVGLQGYADYEGNYDGYVSMEEWYNYIMNENIIKYPQTPQLVDNVPGEFLLLSIDKNCIDPGHISIYHIHPLMYREFVAYHTSIAQSFIAHSNTLAKIRLVNYSPGDRDADLKMYIRHELDGGNLACSVIDPSECQKSGKFVDFVFPDIQTTPGEKYYMVLESATSIHAYGFLSDYNIEDEYTEGACYKNFFNEGWGEVANTDLIFVVYSNDEEKPDFTVHTLEHSLVGLPMSSQIRVSINNKGGPFEGVVKVNVVYTGGQEVLYFNYYDTGESELITFTPTDENGKKLRLKSGNTILATVDPDNEIAESNYKGDAEINNDNGIVVKGEKYKIWISGGMLIKVLIMPQKGVERSCYWINITFDDGREIRESDYTGLIMPRLFTYSILLNRNGNRIFGSRGVVELTVEIGNSLQTETRTGKYFGQFVLFNK